MGSVKSIKTDNFKFEVLSLNGGVAQVRVSALIGDDKHGDVLFSFDGLSRNKPVAINLDKLWETIVGFEERLSMLMSLRRPAA